MLDRIIVIIQRDLIDCIRQIGAFRIVKFQSIDIADAPVGFALAGAELIACDHLDTARTGINGLRFDDLDRFERRLRNRFVYRLCGLHDK